MHPRHVLCLVFASACYSPADREHCGVACPEGVCPGDLQCAAALDNTMVCHEPGKPQCPGLLSPDGGASVDARDCAGHAAPPFMEVCLSRDAPSATIPPSYDLNMGAAFDTDTDCTFVIGAGTGICVLAANDVSISTLGKLRVGGLRPLLVLARHDISITGTLDMASNSGMPAGSVNCKSGDGNGSTAGGSGGAGASFGTAGGLGGRGDFLGQPTTPGVPNPVNFSATTLRAGCRGGIGGGGTGGVSAGGLEGGAVYLLAGHDLVIDGRINASGGGGAGNASSGGGGGGGSGGMIVLEAVHAILIGTNAQIYALGGGGGAGASNTASGPAGSAPSGPTTTAAGGMAPANAGDGGSGVNPATDTAMAGQNAQYGGGGGGGGAGVIRVFPATPFPQGTVAPTPR